MQLWRKYCDGLSLLRTKKRASWAAIKHNSRFTRKRQDDYDETMV